MFRLNLPAKSRESPQRNSSFSADDHLSTPPESSRSLLDFDEDEVTSSSAGSAHESDGEDEEEQIDQQTMEALFDDAAREAIRAYEEQLNLDDEEWLLQHKGDADAVAKDLTEREIRKQKKLYLLRRQKFYELGGRKKARNIMARYGITHLKLLKEHHDASSVEVDTVLTHPRVVATALLRRLRFGNDNLRIDWLRDFFAVMAEKQRTDFDVLKFVDATGVAPPTAENTTTSTQEGQATSDTTRQRTLALDPSALEDAPELAIAIPEESGAIERSDNARSRSTDAKGPSTVGTAEDTMAYIKRKKAAAVSQNTALVEAGIPLDSAFSRPPFGSVDENSFVRGFRVFFEVLAKSDRERRKSEATERSLRRHATNQSPSALEQSSENNPAAFGSTPFVDDDQGARSRSDRQREEFSIRATKVLYETSDTAIPVDSRSASPTASVAASFRGGGADSSFVLDGEEGESAAADFLCREGEVADAGFRFLFGAVDANDRGSVAWDRLIEYLLDASLLVKGSDNTDLDSRAYEFLKDHTNSYFHDLNDVCMIGPREMMAVAGTHITLVSNRASLDFAERNIIKSPLDPFTLAPYYKVTAVTYMTSAKMLAVGTSDNAVRVFMIHTSTRPTLVASAKVDANIRCLLWFKDLLFAGTRQGSLFSFQLLKSKRTGWELNLVRHTAPHRSFITRIVPIPTENCVCTASLDKSMIIHDAKTLKPIFEFPKEHRAGILEMCYCDCINGLVTVSFDTQILVWNVSLLHNRPLPMLDRVRPHTGTIMSVACIEHSAAIVTLCSRGMVKLWSLRSCLCTQTLNVGPHVPMFDAGAKFFRVLVHHCRPSVILPLGSTQLFVFSRRRLYAFEYNLSQRSIVLRNTADDDPLVAVGYNYVEQLYVTFSTSSVKSWDCATCSIRDSFRCPEVADAGGISAAYLHPNGRAYFLGTHRGCIFVKNFSTGTTLHFTRCHPSSACIGLRFCFAAPVPARLKAAANAAAPVVEAADDGGRARPTSTAAMAKAGLGDIVVSISDNSAFVLTHDLRTKLSLDGLDGPRCVDHDPQSSLIIIGDCSGMISVYLQANLSSVRNIPYHILQMPKRVPREVSALCVMHGLSALVAVDEEGTIGMFSLKHHPRPFSCVGVWSHISDSSSGASSTVSAVYFFPAKYLVYIGDEAGSVSVYNVRDAFIASQQGSTSSAPSGAIDAFSAKAPLRTKKSGRSPRSAIAKSPASSTGRRTPQESPRSLGVGSPRGFSSPIASPTHALGGSFAASSRRGRPNLLAAPVVSDSGAAVAHPEIDYRAVGAMVEVVNRFAAHLDAVTCILVVSPENSNVTTESATDISADPAAIHTALMTASQDQCCCGWRLAGTYHLGSLEQYGRCRVPTQTPAAADDLRTLVTRREGQQLEARRDTIKIRSRGLIRLAGTNVLSTIPARLLARAAAVTPQPPPSSSTTAAPASVLRSPRSSVHLDASFVAGGGSATEFSAVTPRSARLLRMVAQSGPELVIRPEIPSRLLMGVQEYHKFINRRRKSLRQLNDAAKIASVPTHDSLAAFASQQGATSSTKDDDPETLSQLLSEYAHGSDYNSVLDELFSVAPASLGDTVADINVHRSRGLNRHCSTLSAATSAVSTSASTIVNRMRNLATGLQDDLIRTAGAVDRSLLHDVGGVYQHRRGITASEVHMGACKMDKGRMDVRIRRVRSGVPQQASAELQDSAVMGGEAADDSAFGAHESSVNFGRRDTAAYASFRHGHDASAGPPPSGGPQSSSVSRASSSRASTSSRPPVVVATSYIAPTRTLRDAATADGKKDRRLGYHTGTLESYRNLARCSPVLLPRHTSTHSNIAPVEPASQATGTATDPLHHHDASPAGALGEDNPSKGLPEAHNELCTMPNGIAAASETLVLTRESLERLLPATPLREKVIQLLLEFGPKLRKDLTVEMSVRHKQRLLRQLVFQNKPLKDIVDDSVVFQRFGQAGSRVHARPSTAPTADARSPSRGATPLTIPAQQELAEHWDSYWEQYCTTMFPPPPQYLGPDGPQAESRRRAASAPRSPLHIQKTQTKVALKPSMSLCHIVPYVATSFAAADRESPTERFQSASSVGTALRRGGLHTPCSTHFCSSVARFLQPAASTVQSTTQ